MKIPKWHEIDIYKINVAWDMGKEGERAHIDFYIEVNGQIYCTQYYDKNTSSVNIGELVSRLTDSLQRQQEAEEIRLFPNEYTKKGL